MKFCWEGSQGVLQGDPYLSQMEASFRVILKVVQAGGQRFMVELAEIGALRGADLGVPLELPMVVEVLLEEYRELFVSP